MSTPTNDWGVDVAKVGAKISFFDITPTSDPSEATVLDWINSYAAELNAVLVSVGITPASVSLASNPDGFLNAQGKLAQRVAADVHLANQNGATDLADSYIDEWNAYLGRLRRNPQSIMGPEKSGVSARFSTGKHLKPARDPFWRPGMKL